MYIRRKLWRVGVLVVWLTAQAALGSGTLRAQDSDATRRKIERIDRDIEAERVRLEAARNIERSVFSEFKAIDNLVNLQTRKDDELKNRISGMESEMQFNVQEESRLNGIVREQTLRLGKRFRAIYVDGPSSFMELALNADSFADLSRREVYYRSLAKLDAKLIGEYRGNIKVLHDVQRQLEADRTRLIELQKDVENTRVALEAQRAGKAELLRAAREDQDTHARVVAELEATSRRVGGVIAGHEHKEEQERKAEEARKVQAALQAAMTHEVRGATPEARTTNVAVVLPEPQPEPAEAREPAEPTEPREPVKSVEPVEPVEPDEPAEPVEPSEPVNVREPDITPIPSIPTPESAPGGFAAQRGRMCGPCGGPVVQSFGVQRNPRFGTQTNSKGIAIGAPSGAPIRAVWDGEVVYAGWFSGYGKVIIISHGDHYYTVYAHASSLAKGAGATVKRGEVIGRVGDTGSLDGPRLYFEVRRGSSPMNPLGWVRLGC